MNISSMSNVARASRVGLWVTALAVLGACGGGGPGNAPPAPPFGTCVPVDGALPSGSSLAGRAGEYRLTMVAASGEATAEGSMWLTVRAGAARRRGGASAPLGGSAEIDLASVGAQPVRGLDSTDVTAPGVLVLERDGGSGPPIVVRFGSEANRADRQGIDGAFMVLEPTLIAEGGFFGGWRSGVRTERSEGYFCAWPVGR